MTAKQQEEIDKLVDKGWIFEMNEKARVYQATRKFKKVRKIRAIAGSISAIIKECKRLDKEY
jgi:chromosome segregation and condensation protein ScpB